MHDAGTVEPSGQRNKGIILIWTSEVRGFDKESRREQRSTDHIFFPKKMTQLEKSHLSHNTENERAYPPLTFQLWVKKTLFLRFK